MNNKYFAKVVLIKDEYSVVINKGSSSGIKAGDRFLVVGLGDVVVDPDTKEELGILEIVRGKVQVDHLQEKMATLKSCEWTKAKDKREIKKVTAKSAVVLALMGQQETVTESISPGDSYILELDGAKIGDFVIKE